MRTVIQMTDLDVITSLQDNFGGSIYECKKQKDHHKLSWKWSFTNTKDSCNFLEIIMPFLHSRRFKRAQDAIHIYNESQIKQKIKTDNFKK